MPRAVVSLPFALPISFMLGATGAVVAAWQCSHELSPPPETTACVATEQIPLHRRSAIRLLGPSDTLRGLVLNRALDVWSDDPGATPLDVVVDGSARRWLTMLGEPFEVLSDDIDADAAAEYQRLHDPTAARPSDWYADYKDFAAVESHLTSIAQRHRGAVTLDTIGASLEHRPLHRLTFGNQAADAPRIVLNGGQHAREWIGVMTTTCVAERLLDNPDDDPRITAFTDRFAVHVVPVVNPDGYQYAWDRDRYWRKNRRDGHGVDLNRNWSVGFAGRGSSPNKRSQIYRGTAAFSEPETAAMRDLLVATRPVAHIDFHSFGQLVLYPWSNKRKKPAHQKEFAALGDAITTAIASTHGKRYKAQAGSDLYVAGGVMTDWAYETTGAKSFVIELRPRGGNGFVLPPEQIRPTCDEALAAVVALGEGLKQD